ncbi:MAG TPA: uridine kinase [Pseudonocardiaceae bacterium]
MRVRPVSWPLLIEELADRIAGAAATRWTRVAVDGPGPAAPGELAERLVDPLRVRGRAVVRVSATDFLRPASLRFERGRHDPDSFYEGWVDLGALHREVLAPTAPDGSGRVLPSLWDAETDRATRADYVRVPPGGVVLVDGSLLLGRGLPFDVTVHLWLSPTALARRIDPEWSWTLPAFARYAEEVVPWRQADVVVRVDDPRRPALVEQL